MADEVARGGLSQKQAQRHYGVQGWSTVYLRLVTDAYPRRIVGHHIHASLHTNGCLQALARAVRGAETEFRATAHQSLRNSSW